MFFFFFFLVGIVSFVRFETREPVRQHRRLFYSFYPGVQGCQTDMDPFQDFMSRVAEADEFGGIDCSDDGFEGFQIDFNSIVPTTVTNYKGN